MTSPVTIEIPPNNGPYMSLYALDQDQYSLAMIYPDTNQTVSVTFKYDENNNQDGNGNGNDNTNKIIYSTTKYMYIIVRTLADPHDEADMKRARDLQEKITFTQPSRTEDFNVPNWDIDSMTKVSNAIAQLEPYFETGSRLFGFRGDHDETAHLVGIAVGFGGLPVEFAFYQIFYPSSEGLNSNSVYKITVKDVPIRSGGFWSITVYNTNGFLEYNTMDSYSLNSLTAKPEADGTYVIYFSQTKADYMTNWIWIFPGWNYAVRLYEPEEPIINNEWQFPPLTNA